jgi:hypothetical protein
MSRTRVRGTQRKGRPLKLELHRFFGVSLGGGKTDKTCLSVIEYYPDQRKLFLSRLYDKVRSEGEVSADLQITKIINECPPPVENVTFDVPLQLPFALLHKFKGVPFENSQSPEIRWMWDHWRKYAKKKKPVKLFTPYTERCVEMYLATELEEVFHLPHALGANLAPLTARAQYLTRFLDFPCLEAFPKLSLWRIGNSLNMPKSQLRFHRHWEGGTESRRLILSKMQDKNLAFIYDQDFKTLVESPQAFDSFLCALTGLLSFMGHTEPRPKGFPRRESWIEIPKKIFPWP